MSKFFELSVNFPYISSTMFRETRSLHTSLHYYPFGLMMPGRSWSDGYRFGFNGQEQDDEVYGDGILNTALYWEYDTRLGRRWNVDPVNQNISNYSVFENSPIIHIDPLGNTSSKPWELRVDLSGKTSYVSTSQNDDIYSFMSEYNIGFDEAVEIFNNNELSEYIPTRVVGNEISTYEMPCSTCSAKKVGAGLILNAKYYSLNWSRSSDQQKGNHIAQSIRLKNVDSQSDFILDLDQVFGNRPSFSKTGNTHIKITANINVDENIYNNVVFKVPTRDEQGDRFLNVAPDYQYSNSPFHTFQLTSYYRKVEGPGIPRMDIIVPEQSDKGYQFIEDIFYPK